MACKKIVFVIVEGPSDETALGTVLNRLYNNNEVFVRVMHCDITSDNRIEPDKIVINVCDIVKSYAGQVLKSKDFKEIIHIVDMDGAYAPDNCIVEEPDAEKVFYTTKEMRTNKVQKIKERNNHKRQCLERLISKNKIWNIPYRIFYMSCNLDHVLYDIQNSSNEEKDKNAHNFAKKYNCDLKGFLEYICNSNFSVMGDYKGSWETIKKDKLSLERHCNLGICFGEEILQKFL